MLKLLSRQATKALRNPFRSPLPVPLYSSPPPLYGLRQTCHLHNEPAPFSGPPSYATLARRFSDSSPSPIWYFTQKKAREAIDRGEFVDIHDIGGVNPKDCHVSFTDMDNDTLQSEISKLVDIPYLQEATTDEAGKVAREIHGFLYGRELRMILPCVLKIKNNARWVFFVVNQGSPLTFISKHARVAQAFGLGFEETLSWNTTIAGHPNPVYLSPSDSHFSELNLLGMDFCSRIGFIPLIRPNNLMVTYYLGDGWEVNSDSISEPKQ
ncbi:uncharacterized protein Z518_06565 [Rhinocladiella mackenziei CBS 650.93]|uniref:Rhinocladiella mackenziei CBS 650.93 unplaced genomic scaffold supercont1.5, whole genome shotgun sequence n=1 Tax=Rhinocladiella mackenziei CBS 650.93 TaxID=1442369 RepID=A0A0D2J2A3_9EURO|nr:uncharacterized protein Z518_06565 [Rhinocladiella mackenziei CBS 650.93]KIX03015.1 hypothetical protein Z518_06565 [Rhinocladiella mackenziei CBS 650.93]